MYKEIEQMYKVMVPFDYFLVKCTVSVVFYLIYYGG